MLKQIFFDFDKYECKKFYRASLQDLHGFSLLISQGYLVILTCISTQDLILYFIFSYVCGDVRQHVSTMIIRCMLQGTSACLFTSSMLISLNKSNGIVSISRLKELTSSDSTQQFFFFFLPTKKKSDWKKYGGNHVTYLPIQGMFLIEFEFDQ